MRFRFMYLDSDGVETKVETPDDLRRCVEDGLVGEETVLYDARTREWGPARVHTAYREIVGADDEAPDEVAGEGANGIEGDSADATPGLSLADEMPDTVGRFLERRAQERREEDERRPTALDGLHVVDEGAVWREAAESAADPPSAPPPLEDDAPPGGSRLARPDPAPVTMQVNATGGRARRRRRIMAVATAGVGVVAIFAARGILGGVDSQADAAPVIDTGPPPAANPVLEAQIQDAEGSAFQDMIVAMDSLRGIYDVAGAPRDWLSGHYLANASEYGDVQEWWQRYDTYVRELRNRDEELFRRGFVDRLERSGLEGPVLSMRLARATEEFRATGASRDTVYSAMSEMATAALALHDLLVEREDDIVYTPVRPGVVTRDPVVEAVPSDDALRTEIWDTLDRLFAGMDVVLGGVPGSGGQLSDAALEGIRSTVQRHVP